MMMRVSETKKQDQYVDPAISAQGLCKRFVAGGMAKKRIRRR